MLTISDTWHLNRLDDRVGPASSRPATGFSAIAGAQRESYAPRMGRFIYDSAGVSVDLDDRTLAHLRIVVMNKLRRSESFMFDVDVGDGSGRRGFWMHPSVPLQFHFYGSRQPRINRAWIEDLMQAASSPHGLSIVPEPPEDAAPRGRTEHQAALALSSS